MSQPSETLPAVDISTTAAALPVSDPGAKAGQPFEISVLALQNLTIFPETVIPLAVGRPRSIAAVEAALATQEKLLGCITVRPDRADDTDAKTDDLYETGTLVMIKRMERVGDAMRIVVQGSERIKVVEWKLQDPHMRAVVQILPEPHVIDAEEVEAARRNLQEMIQQALSLLPNIPPEVRVAVLGSVDAVRLAYFLASVLTLGVEEEQKMLEANTADELLHLAHQNLARELEILQLRSKIASEAQSEMDKAQRDYVLRQQMRAIQKELGEDESGEAAEAQLLRERLEKAELPEEVRAEAERELKRLERLPSAAPDYQVIRTYLDYVLELPWMKSSADKLDLAEARKILDEDHYGLEDVKERILEFLAVIKLRPDTKSPILLFVGPPGVGKTSLGRSIARALGRQFERMSLGGVRDEAELRGHRRTYIGALPGRIIQAVRRAGVNNPVMMLDEIDKLGNDYRGDPAAALLEILDPQQNNSFRDHYLDLPFDLSKIFFIATANQLGPIPAPLRDRMEMIRLAGYSDREKLEIARRYLVPRQIQENGLNTAQLKITDEAIGLMAESYTREAGVRQLERTIGSIARKTALKIAQAQAESVTVNESDLRELLGPPKFYPELARKELPAGVATGMAWTEMGGEVLFIEATLLPGGRGLTITGQLGEVMQESARAAQSYLWSHAVELGIDPEIFKNYGVHLHVPAGAIPKDGPSAGVTITSALASLYTGRRVRPDTAMTGEITLSGLVFPIGGVKEKVLAAYRAGIRRILLPSRNEADADEIPDDVRNDLQIIFISRISEVLDSALEVLVANPPPPIVSDAMRGGRTNEPEPLTVKGK
ncbi:MAG TPA: endopeptidase La [Pyrinomonadaceae bacterium]|jgi:ATP-dependent Lon protease|nr:endopeptidase La [Pyrinomonadaceae bacterium]